MLQVSSEFIASNGVNIHYYRTGGAKPPLVLAHGITDDGLCWTSVAEVLSHDYDVIMVDARGHGKSEAPTDGHTLKKLGTDLAGVIQALKLEKPILLGHSMGAITCLVLAGLFPELPRAILLEDPPPFWRSLEGDTRNNESINGLKGWIQANKRKTRDDLSSEYYTNNPTWSDVELDSWVNSKHRYSLSITALVHPEDIRSIDLPHLFQQITCPALFIRADVEKGAASSKADITELGKILPQIKVAHVANAGHNIRREQFARYMDVVQEFLADPSKYESVELARQRGAAVPNGKMNSGT
ncbi:MAG: alpha/beta hydrolase [Anaerolineales bacterium]